MAKQNKVIQEGVVKKGGINQKPITPKPPLKPSGQGGKTEKK